MDVLSSTVYTKVSLHHRGNNNVVTVRKDLIKSIYSVQDLNISRNILLAKYNYEFTCTNIFLHSGKKRAFFAYIISFVHPFFESLVANRDKLFNIE